MDIIQTLWSETAGRIFLITLGCYLFGYMIYGGYVLTFFGGRGSLPFGMADFSIADLISIFPATISTIFNIIPKALFAFLEGLTIHFVIPVATALIVRYLLGFQLNQFIFDANLLGFLAILGPIFWLSGYVLIVFLRPKIPIKILFIVMECFGAILYFATLSTTGEPPSITPISMPISINQILQIFYSVLSVVFVFEIISLPYIFGMEIAQKAIKLNLLIRIDRLTLRQPILRAGMKKVVDPSETGNKPSFRELWLAQKSLRVDMEPDAYEWLPAPDRNLYLIATFEKFVLLFAPTPGPDSEDGVTLMLNRDMILSIETEHRSQTITH
jgi:hypothetical protein